MSRGDISGCCQVRACDSAISADRAWLVAFVCLLGLVMTAGAGCTPPLVKAAARNDVAEVRSLLDKGAVIDAFGPVNAFEDWTGRTALHEAAYGDHNEVAELLLERGADVDGKTYKGDVTPLYIACCNGHVEMVKTLLDYGADVNKRSFRGFTPVCVASGAGHQEIVDILLESGADVNRASVSPEGGDFGFVPLYRACGSGHIAVAKTLLDHGADVDGRSSGGYTPLHMAAGKGHRDIVTLLVDRGADLNARDDKAWTALHWARRRGQTETAELLISKGADTGAKNNKGKTPSEMHVLTEEEVREVKGIGGILQAALSVTQLVLSASP